MQGHYQVTRLPVPHDPTLFPSTFDQEDTVADYIVISRRSRDRAGLRYQRRGIDDEAHVANWVESESLMRVWREGSGWNYFGYVQVRGSIPLFWTQVGYGLKPPPVMAPERTHDQNLEMVRRHFERYVLKYGPHVSFISYSIPGGNDQHSWIGGCELGRAAWEGGVHHECVPGLRR